MISLIWLVFFQIQFPRLQSPTPIPTITPYVQEATATPVNFTQDVSEAEDRIEDLDNRVITTDNQLFVDGRPLVPQQNTSMWAYIKWGTSSANRSLFGSFSNMMLGAGFLLLLVITSLLLWIWTTFIVVIIKTVLFIVRYFIPGLG